jgi:hypothetical protein
MLPRNVEPAQVEHRMLCYQPYPQTLDEEGHKRCNFLQTFINHASKSVYIIGPLGVIPKNVL